MTTTFNLKQAAEFLKMKTGALRAKAAVGDVPADKPGKSWVFIKEDLVDWMRARQRVRKEAQERRTKECHLVNETASTGRDFRTVESEYNDLLGLQ